MGMRHRVQKRSQVSSEVQSSSSAALQTRAFSKNSPAPLTELHASPGVSSAQLDLSAQNPSIQRHGVEEDEHVQLHGGQGGFTVDGQIERQIQTNQSGGTPLPSDTRQFLEPRFGYNFEQVRVHTDQQAVQLNRDLHAHAFTHGNHIYFNQGQYNPGSSHGKELLAHELTHTIQQTGGASIHRSAEPQATGAACPCAVCHGTVQRQAEEGRSPLNSSLIHQIQRKSEVVQRACPCPSCTGGADIQLKTESGHQAGCSCPQCAGQIQAKMVVGAAGDRFEREADTVARQVMRMSDEHPSHGIQRHTEEEEVQLCPIHTTQASDQVQRQVAANPILVQQASPNTIQRHAAFEHYLLGEVAPKDLANIAYVREVRKKQQGLQIEAALHESGLLSGVDPEELQRQRDEIDSLQKEIDTAKHVLEGEMARLEAYMNKPEATPPGAPEPGEVKKNTDQTWQVPYVRLPVKQDDKETGQTGKDSIIVSYSEINTFPDFFGNPETIANTRKKKVLHLLQGVRQQSYIELDNLYQELFGESRSALNRAILPDKDFKGARGPRAQAVNAFAYEKRTEMQVDSTTKRKKGEKSEQYFAALERNACHFAPYSWDAWESYHNTARKLAQDSANKKAQAQTEQSPKKEVTKKEADELSNQALLQNAFGEHYLQDSFAAGHLIDKTGVMQEFTQWLERNATTLLGKKKASSMGFFDDSQAQWSMAKMVANTKLESNPQALDDKMHRQQDKKKNFLNEAAALVGLKPTDDIIFMMWWRSAALVDSKSKHLTPQEVAQQCELPSVKGNAVAATQLMEELVKKEFVKKKVDRSVGRKLSFGLAGTKKDVYSLNQTMVNTLKSKGGPYQSTVGPDNIKKRSKDFTSEASEFNLAAYNAFMSNAYIQGATKFFHDTYCKKGLEVITREGVDIGTIYGDAKMLSAGAQKGVEYAAETSQMSREAIFNIIDGNPGAAAAPDKIQKRFPATIVIPATKENPREEKPLDKWNKENLYTDAMFKEAASVGAHIAYKAKTGGGISSGNAIDVERIAKHDSGDF